MTKAQRAERDEARAKLREWLKPGDTVYTVLRHVSRSGMQRTIQLIQIDDGEPSWLGYNVALALGMSYDRDREGVKIGGCGMDMGFAIVYELGAALWPQGVPCTGEGCLSNDHNNARWETCAFCTEGYRDTDVAPCVVCDGRGKIRDDPRGPDVIHKGAGYALRQRWL